MTFIALLKGINVGGVKKIKMAGLEALSESIGFKNVKTYLQSGNLVFDTAGKNAETAKTKLVKAILNKYGFEVGVIIRTGKEIAALSGKNPFLKNGKVPGNEIHVVFLEETPVRIAADMKKDPKEQYLVNGKEVYLYCPNGYGNTKLNNRAFEKALGVTATTRNWNTVLALAGLSRRP